MLTLKKISLEQVKVFHKNRAKKKRNFYKTKFEFFYRKLYQNKPL